MLLFAYNSKSVDLFQNTVTKLIAHSGNSEMKKVFDLAMNNQE
jgi:hypothetical protein